MATPKTILEISKQPNPVIDWKKAALILIDFQNEYSDGKLALGETVKTSIDNANKLIGHARSQSAPIFHVTHHGGMLSELFNPKGIAADIVPEITVMEEEPVVKKPHPNAFANTELRELIDLSARNVLVFAGFMSHMCVSSTVRSSLEQGFTNFVCNDACYTRDLRGVDGETIPSSTVHQVSMAALQDRYATVCSTAELILSWK